MADRHTLERSMRAAAAAPAQPRPGLDAAIAGGVGFETALTFIKLGYRAQRFGWNGKNMWVAIQVPDANSKMGLPYIYMSTVDGKLVPWLASQTDLLAHDWAILDEGGVTISEGVSRETPIGALPLGNQ